MHQIKPHKPLLLLFFLIQSFCVTVAGPTRLQQSQQASSLYYTFSVNNNGGVAKTVVDTNTGKIISQNIFFQSPFFYRPQKIKLSDCGNYLLATSQHPGIYNIALINLITNQTRLVSVPRTPDEIDAWGNKFVIGADDQMCYILDGSTGKITHRWNGKHLLYPEGRRMEYLTVTSDGTAWTSWQKDSTSGRRRGSRVVAIDVTSGRTVTDIHMPRALPQLHLADFKEQGPNPEIIIPSPKTNTMLLSMDLYGGFALADLDAMREGRWQNLTYHTSSLSGKWGTAFPDRALIYPYKNKDFIFIANSGKEGGVIWIDLSKRQIVQSFLAPPGLESPAIVGKGRHIVSPVAGKTKYRFFGDLYEKRQPVPQLYVFDVSPGQNPRLNLRTLTLPTRAYRVAPVAPNKNDLVLLSAGDKNPTDLIVLHASSGIITDRVPALGKVHRVAY